MGRKLVITVSQFNFAIDQVFAPPQNTCGHLYIAGANSIRKVSSDGIITTLATAGNGDGRPATKALLLSAGGFAEFRRALGQRLN